MKKIVPKTAITVPAQAKRVFKGIIYDVYQWPEQMFDGTTATYEMLRRPDTVKVIAIKDGKLVINKEEQPHHWPFYDIPGGRHDVPTESSLEAAQRELREETGMSFKTWKLLEVIQPLAKIEQFVYVYLASDFEEQVAVSHDSGEKIETLLMDLDEVKDLAKKPAARYIPMSVLEQAKTVDDLLALPEFEGQEVDR